MGKIFLSPKDVERKGGRIIRVKKDFMTKVSGQGKTVENFYPIRMPLKTFSTLFLILSISPFMISKVPSIFDFT